MKSEQIKHRFNMVEIALAMAIIAIGLSSILVLFPVGINASKAATADNNLSDIAEYMISYMRAGCASEWRRAAETGTSSSLAPSLPSSYPSDKIIAPNDPSKEIKWKAIQTSKNGNNSRLYYYETPAKGLYLFRQVSVFTDSDGSSVEIPEFSAIIKIWRDKLKFNIPLNTAPLLGEKRNPQDSNFTEITINPANSNKENHLFAHALCLELSWPAEVREENREKRTFRFEIFNESFKLEHLL